VRTNDRNETIKERGVGKREREREGLRRITCRGRRRSGTRRENILLFSNPVETSRVDPRVAKSRSKFPESGSKEKRIYPISFRREGRKDERRA